MDTEYKIQNKWMLKDFIFFLMNSKDFLLSFGGLANASWDNLLFGLPSRVYLFPSRRNLLRLCLFILERSNSFMPLPVFQ